MTELILQTDPLEFQNSRQSTKIMFLQQELQQVQDYARDLEHIVKVNKEVLRIATSQQPRPNPKSKSPAQNESASTFDTSSNRDKEKNLQLLVEQLQEENIKLLEIIEKAKKERNTAQSKALISEQICEEAQRHESETVHELEEKITELRKLLQDKEYAIQELEKIKPITEQEGVVIKYREVMAPTEQNIKFHNEIDALNGMLSKVSKELNKLQSENQELASINFSLTTELAKIKATLTSPLNYPSKINRLGAGENMIGSAVQEQPLFQGPLEFLDENSPFPSPLPSHAAFEAFHSKAPVPKLDLSKAKQIQEQYAKKLSQPQQQNYNGYDAAAVDKLKQFEEELELTRKKLSHEMINNRLVSEELSRSNKQTSQLMAINEILIKSNKRYEEKWQRIFYTLEFYKDFYHKYIDHVSKGAASGGHGKSSSVSTPKFEMIPKFRGNIIDTDPERMIREFKRFSEETGKQITVGIMEANEEEEDQLNQPKEKPAETFELSKEQCKIYLLNLSKDLYVKTHIRNSSVSRKVPQILNEVKEKPAIIPIVRLRRSLSNPLEYASEVKKVMYEKEPKKDRNIFKIKNSKKMLGTIEDQNEGAYENLETSGMQHIDEKIKANIHGGEEMISFSVDPDEFNKNKMVEVSFISNNDLLDNLRNN